MSSQRSVPFSRTAGQRDRQRTDRPSDVPEPPDGPDEASDLDDFDVPCTDADDESWEVFIADDDERDPLPDLGDFGGMERGAWSMEPD
jgi:hypothetical protein